MSYFLDQKESEELKRVIEYLDSKKRQLAYNDPERREINFQKQAWELMDRTGVKFHDDPDGPYLSGSKEGLAEVMSFMKKKKQRAIQAIQIFEHLASREPLGTVTIGLRLRLFKRPPKSGLPNTVTISGGIYHSRKTCLILIA